MKYYVQRQVVRPRRGGDQRHWKGLEAFEADGDHEAMQYAILCSVREKGCAVRLLDDDRNVVGILFPKNRS